MFDFHAEINAADIRQALGEESGGAEQRHGECDLGGRR